jgi:pimeloyl-ACP methyl ester carboxylesterase
MPFTQRFFRSQDGLKLAFRDYQPLVPRHLPVVALHGLARSSADFHVLAEAVSGHRTRPRRVVALDYRGRGLSDRDPNWQNYDLKIELGDLQAFLTAAGIDEAIFIGTSRGGLLTMALGMVRGGAIRGAVLNDIGPRIEGAGLARIKGYVGKMPQPRNYDEAVRIQKQVAGSQFTSLSEAEWRAFAELTWEETPKGLVPRYDPALSKGLEALDLTKPLPDIWPYFLCLKAVPVLSVRGANSDLFSEATQAEMSKLHPRHQAHVVAGQGHAPLLMDAPTINRIIGFLAECDDAERVAA